MISCDHEALMRFFPRIGSFTADKLNHTAFVDANFRSILSLDVAENIRESELNVIISDATALPCLDMSGVYRRTCGAEIKWLKFYIDDRADSVSGFVEDVSEYVQQRKNSSAMLRNEFLSKVQDYISNSRQTAYMAAIHITAKHAKGTAGERCIASAAEVLLRYSAYDVLMGVKTYKAFWVFIKNKTAEQAIEILRNMRHAAEEKSSGNVQISLCIGWCEYPCQSVSADDLLVKADFAAYEAVNAGAGVAKRFEQEDFAEKRRDFAEISSFNRLIDDNLLTYAFQPVVDARNGEIIAYEALMRANDCGLTPLDVLRIAEKQNRLYDIERLTFANVMKILSQNQHCFETRKLFINSITSSVLSDRDFDSLAETYGELFEKTVWEITEQTKPTDDVLDTIKNRARRMKCTLAVDDYGSGYANTNNLLKILPDIVKIDADLIRDIDSNNHKQHFVSGVIYFCSVNGIKVLAEGVETAAELRWVIKAGVDYIQGYYTSRPKPLIVQNISENVKSEIIALAAER